MERKEREYPLYVFVSNQSFDMPVADVEIVIDGRQLFRGEMSTGSQHNWEQITISVRSGKHSLVLNDAKTGVHKSEILNVDQDLWVVITFHGPPPQFRVNVSNRTIGLL